MHMERGKRQGAAILALIIAAALRERNGNQLQPRRVAVLGVAPLL